MTGSRKPINATYKLHGEVLETVSCAKYLGVDVSSDLSWGSHIDRIVNTANRSSALQRESLKTKIPALREAVYTQWAFGAKMTSY